MARYDQIRLQNWSVHAAIGAYEHEKIGTQELILDLKLEGDFAVAGRSDVLADAVDYDQLRQNLETWLLGRRWTLLEAFAEEVCREVLRLALVRRVRLRVSKPGALAPILVSYRIDRKKKGNQ